MAWSIDALLETIGLTASSKTGLALSGGGARGFAHIGVLMAFEKFDINIDILSGVSAGSIAAVLYASGLNPVEITECFATQNKFGSFTEWALPKQGFFKLDRFAKLLDSWLPVKHLEELSRPTVVCATDFENGRSVGWAKGEIVPRVLASCSIPIVFKPVKINGVNYVDGGVLRNLPAWAIREHCKVLIGSNCSPLNRKFSYKGSLLDIAVRSFQLMAKANTLADINMCDHIIQSEGLAQYGTFDIHRMQTIIRYGYDAACRVLEKINS